MQCFPLIPVSNGLGLASEWSGMGVDHGTNSNHSFAQPFPCQMTDIESFPTCHLSLRFLAYPGGPLREGGQ
jgi:hypothetical protein